MPTIVVLTSYMHQRGGDVVAAVSFIKAILAKSPEMKFEWIVRRDISGYQKDFKEFLEKELGEQSRLVNLTIVDSEDYKKVTITPEGVKDNQTSAILTNKELKKRSDLNWGTIKTGWKGWRDSHDKLKSPPIASKISSANVIAVIGNPHRLVEADHKVLHQLGKKIITVSEYSLKHRNNEVYYPDDVKMTTGFGRDERGVYIDATVKTTEGFEKIDPEDKSFLDHLINRAVEEKDSYHLKTELFYGYFFDDETLSAEKYTVTAELYIQNVIKLAIERGEKLNVDIVIPGFADPAHLLEIYKKALDKLPKGYREKIGKASYNAKTKPPEHYTSTSLIDTNVTDKIAIRLINPTHLQRSTVQALLNESEPFMGLTGDASWIEGLIKGKITCYQTMRWKKIFYENFLLYLGTKDFLKDSYLLQFYKLQKPSEKKSSEERWEEMRELYRNNKEEMLLQAKHLAEVIEAEKDINQNLIPEFINMVLAEEVPEEQLPEEHKKSQVLPKSQKSTQGLSLRVKVITGIFAALGFILGIVAIVWFSVIGIPLMVAALIIGTGILGGMGFWVAVATEPQVIEKTRGDNTLLSESTLYFHPELRLNDNTTNRCLTACIERLNLLSELNIKINKAPEFAAAFMKKSKNERDDFFEKSKQELEEYIKNNPNNSGEEKNLLSFLKEIEEFLSASANTSGKTEELRSEPKNITSVFPGNEG